MSLDDFLELTEVHLPTSSDIVRLCESLGIAFKVRDDGSPALRFNSDLKSEATAIAEILKRQPWRTQVIEAKNLTPRQKPDPIESLPQPCKMCGLMILWCQTEGETVMAMDVVLTDPGPYPLYAVVNGLSIPCEGPGYRQHVQTCNPPKPKRLGF